MQRVAALLSVLILLALFGPWGPLACGSGRPDNDLAPDAASDAPAPSEVTIVRPGDPSPPERDPAPEASDPSDPAEPDADADSAAAERAGAIRVADAAVERARAGVEEAEAELDAARDLLARAEAAALRARTEPVPDPVVFREVQRQLLEDPALSHVAIGAEVEDGIVILRGAVPDAGTAEVAIDLAERTAGVKAVRSELRLVE